MEAMMEGDSKWQQFTVSNIDCFVVGGVLIRLKNVPQLNPDRTLRQS